MKISIITICLNDLSGLEQTFESICYQTTQEFEWWVVDGRSTDGTADWLETHHRFPGGWRSEPDHGIYHAMNKGINLATGDYLLFMNSGDKFAGPEVMAKLISCIEQEKKTPHLVYGDSLDVEADGTSYYRFARRPAHITVGMPTRHQSMLYSKGSLLNERYPEDFRFSGDYALTASMLMKDDDKVLIVDFAICEFSMGGRHETCRIRALKEDFRIRKDILRKSLAMCLTLFCLHWLHHHARRIFPALNKIIIYGSSRTQNRLRR